MTFNSYDQEQVLSLHYASVSPICDMGIIIIFTPVGSYKSY